MAWMGQADLLVGVDLDIGDKVASVAAGVIAVLGVLVALSRWIYNRWTSRRARHRSREVLGPDRRVYQVNHLELGVHPCIDPSGEGGRLTGQTRQSPYVFREYDPALRTAVAGARRSSSIVLLVGSSSTGKTRSAAEAIYAELSEWKIQIPLTISALQSMIDQKRSWNSTVLWLNELQVFLGDSQADEMAEALLGLLNRSSRLLIFGTLWPEYLQAYQQRSDRDIALHTMLGKSTQIIVPVRFSPGEFKAAADLAHNDPAMREAVSHTRDSATVSQVLAAGPDLINHWAMAPDELSRAVIESAADVRLLGGDIPLRNADILDLAMTRLETSVRARVHLESQSTLRAMTFATRQLKGAASLLTPRFLPSGEVGYVIADYLYETLHVERATAEIPDEFWEVLKNCPLESDEIFRIAISAGRRGAVNAAENLYRAAMEDGHPSAARGLAESLAGQLRTNEAADVYAKAFAVNPGDIWLSYARFLRSHNQLEEAESILRQAINSGVRSSTGGTFSRWWQSYAEDRDNAGLLGWASQIHLFGPETELEELLKTAGKPDQIVELWREAVHRSVPYARQHLAWQIQKNFPEEAERLLRTATSDGEAGARYALAKYLDNNGRTSEAMQTWQDGAEQNEPEAAHEWAKMLLRANRPDVAEQALAEAVRRNVPAARLNYAQFLLGQGRLERGIEVLGDAALDGSPVAATMLAEFLARKGDASESEMALRTAVAKGDETAWSLLVRLLLDRDGLDADVVALLEKEVYRGRNEATEILGRLLMMQGNYEHAKSVWKSILLTSPDKVHRGLASLYAWTGDLADAVAQLKVGVNAGARGCLESLIDVLDCLGKPDQVTVALQQGIVAGHWNARQRLASHLESMGRYTETETLLRASAEAGELNCGQALGRFLVRSGRTEEALEVFKFALENGENTVVEPYIDALISCGDFETAETVLNNPSLFIYNSEQLYAMLEFARNEMQRPDAPIRQTESSDALRSDPSPTPTTAVRKGVDEHGSAIPDATDSPTPMAQTVSTMDLRHRFRHADWKSQHDLVAHLLQSGRSSEAVDVAQTSAIMGDHQGLVLLAIAQVRNNETEAAFRALWAAVAVGERDATTVFHQMSTGIGSIESAIFKP